MSSCTTNSVISSEVNGDCVLLMGNVALLSIREIRIEAKQANYVIFERKNGVWCYASEVPVMLKIQGKSYKLPAS